MKKINKVLYTLAPTTIILPFLTLSCSKNQSTSKDISSEGGKSENGLEINKYLEILNQLNLNKDLNFEELNSENLTNLLHQNKKYENLQIEINNKTNSKEKNLYLNLTGNFHGKNINDELEIKGFNNKNYQNYFSINNIKINLNHWFINKQPIQEITNLILINQINTKISLFESIDFSLINQNTDIELLTFQEMQEKFDIINFDLNLNQNNELEINLEFKTKYKKFVNNKWELMDDENQQILKQKITSNNKCFLPTIENLKIFLLNNMNINKEEITKYFASYFYGDALYNWNENSSLTHQSILSFINYDQIFNEYKNIYFPNRNFYLELLDDMSLFNTNESNQSLNFVVSLIDDTMPENRNITRNFEINNMKNINQYLDQIKNNINNIEIRDDSLNANNIKNQFRSQILEVFQTGISKEFNSNDLPINNLNLFNYDLFNANPNLISQVNNNYFQLAALGKQFNLTNEKANEVFNNILNVKNGLLSIDTNEKIEENAIFINSIVLNPSDTNLITIKRRENNPNIVEVSIKTKLVIELKNLLINEDVVLHLIVLKSNFDTNNQNDIKILNERIANKLFNEKEIFNKIDVSDLTLTKNDILSSWSFFINKMYSLFPYFNLSSSGKYFFEIINEKINSITLPFKEYDRKLIKDNSLKLADAYTNLIQYAPINQNNFNNVYWILQKVSDWMSYSKSGIDNQTLSSSLLNNKGVCEAYSKLTHVLLNSFNINSSFQPGNIISGNLVGPHVWNQYQIDNDWFNIDTTFADTSISGTFNIINERMTNTNYLAFSNSHYTSSREYHDNWYEKKHETNYDINAFKDFVPYSTTNNNFTRRVVFNDKWYVIENNNIIETTLENKTKKSLYQFQDLEYTQYGLWQLGKRIYFIDFLNNQSVLNYFDIEKNLIVQLQTFNQIINKFYIENNNRIIISLLDSNSNNEIIDQSNNYNLVNTKNIIAIKNLFTINSLWLHSISIGNNINELSLSNFNVLFNKMIDIVNSITYSEENYLFMIDFKNIVFELLNK